MRGWNTSVVVEQAISLFYFYQASCTNNTRLSEGTNVYPDFVRLGRADAAFPQPDQRKVTQRRHRPALDQMDVRRAFTPTHDASEQKFRAPAEPPRNRGKAELEQAPRAALGADM